MRDSDRGTSINPIYKTTTTIRYPDQDGHGTGFFFNSSGNTYLVTNRHVLKDEDESVQESHNPDSIRIFFRGFSDISQLSYYDIDLTEAQGNDWYVHPDFPEIDIAVIPVPQRLSTVSGETTLTGSLALSSDHFLEDTSRIQGGDSALIVGYPGMFAGRNINLPVVRSALISSPYGVNFDNDPYFITDARMHPGTSGSPVLASPESMGRSPEGNLNIGGQQIALLGVHSASFKQDAEDPGEEWLHLNKAWYAETIPEIIDGI